MKLASALAGLLLASGCGYVGPPQPPALNIPSAVQDLRGIEFGDQILVQFTVPILTTDGLVQQRLRSVELYAGPIGQPFDREQWASSASRYAVPVTAPGPVEYQFPVGSLVGQEIVISVRVTGETGRVSDWGSNAFFFVNQPLAAPSAVQPANAPAGVALRWTGGGPRYRVLRSEPNAPAEADRVLVPIGESDAPEYIDRDTNYGTRYQYIVVAIEGERQQSLPSDAVFITPTDVFAPSVPSGVNAVPSPQSVELSWTPSLEDDFQGYNVRRSVDMGPFEIVAQLVPTPAYSDRAAEPGKQYRYTVTAVDTLRNESDPSEPVTAVLP